MNLEKITLSIIIPCYNERGHVLEIVNKILETDIPNKEIIVVDDMSTDGTRDLLEKEVKPHVSKIVYHTDLH